nr:hypothetical protein [Clostridia bacterium]
MTKICISDEYLGAKGLQYIKNCISELAVKTGATAVSVCQDRRRALIYDCPDYYADIFHAEIADRIAEVIAVGYKYEYFKREIKAAGLNRSEREILLASLIAADLTEDKKYAFDRIKGETQVAIDGIYNFRLKALKKKWKDVVEYIPQCFLGSQLKDFVVYLIENRNKRAYVDDQKVYDNYYRRLKRCALLGGEDMPVIREVLLSGCGEVEIRGALPKEDERYLKEFYGDRVFFTQKNASF